jgi:hypothetical protein
VSNSSIIIEKKKTFSGDTSDNSKQYPIFTPNLGREPLLLRYRWWILLPLLDADVNEPQVLAPSDQLRTAAKCAASTTEKSPEPTWCLLAQEAQTRELYAYGGDLLTRTARGIGYYGLALRAEDRRLDEMAELESGLRSDAALLWARPSSRHYGPSFKARIGEKPFRQSCHAVHMKVIHLGAQI